MAAHHLCSLPLVEKRLAGVAFPLPSGLSARLESSENSLCQSRGDLPAQSKGKRKVGGCHVMYVVCVSPVVGCASYCASCRVSGAVSRVVSRAVPQVLSCCVSSRAPCLCCSCMLCVVCVPLVCVCVRVSRLSGSHTWPGAVVLVLLFANYHLSILCKLDTASINAWTYGVCIPMGVKQVDK